MVALGAGTHRVVIAYLLESFRALPVASEMLILDGILPFVDLAGRSIDVVRNGVRSVGGRGRRSTHRTADPRRRLQTDIQTRDILDEMFAELFEANLMPRMSTLSLRYMLTAACQNVFTLATEIRYLYGVDPTHEAQIQHHTDAVIGLFLRNV